MLFKKTETKSLKIWNRVVNVEAEPFILLEKCDMTKKTIQKKTTRRRVGPASSKVKKSPFVKPKRPSWMSDKLYEKRVGTRPNASFPCRGCQKPLPILLTGEHRVLLIDYFIHCIEECEEYQKLNLIETCTSCNCKFLNKFSRIQHQMKTDCKRDDEGAWINLSWLEQIS